MSKTAVVLFNLGGPDSLAAVEPFLFNLFSDPDIFKIPIFGTQFARLISKFRAPKVMKQYQHIGSNSPINRWTETQRRMLELELKKENHDIDVYTGMRYWTPLISLTASQIYSRGYDKVILLPLYPHYSKSTTGSSINEWNRFFYGNKDNVTLINNYCTNETYIEAVNQRIDQALEKFDDSEKVDIVFSAHGVPVSYIKNGDPYNTHINSTVEAIMSKRNHSHTYHLCYQSKVGPVKWLEPSTEDMLQKLGLSGIQNIVIVPISFASDHIETLFEINVEYRHVAHAYGIKKFEMTEGLNDSEIFISALKNLVLKELGKN